MEIRLQGLRTAVTGDLAGHGYAVAHALAAAGASVAFCTPRAGDAAMAVQALSEHGSYVTVTTIDLAQGAALAEWVAESAQEFSGLDVVVCSLGDAPADAALQLLRAARPLLLRGTAKAFFVMGVGADTHSALAAEAEGLQLHALPADGGAGDALLQLLAPR